MKHFIHVLLTISVLVLETQISNAQKIEISAGVSGNLSNYSGSAASSNVQYGTFPVFSKTLTAGYGADIQAKFIAKTGFIIGLQTGYDQLQTRANVNSYANLIYYGDPGFFTINTPGLGAILTPTSGYESNIIKLINLNPYFGYRFKRKRWSIDFTAGAELGFIVENKQHQVLTSPYNDNQSFYYAKSPNDYQQLARQDYRLKGGLDINYKRLGINMSYAHGLNILVYKNPNYQYNYDQGSAYSQVVKLGVSYRIL